MLVTSADDPAGVTWRVIGSHTDLAALRRVAAGMLLTFDHERPERAVGEAGRRWRQCRTVAAGAGAPRTNSSSAASGCAWRRRAHTRASKTTKIDVFAARVDAPIVVKEQCAGFDGRERSGWHVMAMPVISLADTWLTAWRWVDLHDCRHWWRVRSARVRRGRWSRRCNVTARVC